MLYQDRRTLIARSIPMTETPDRDELYWVDGPRADREAYDLLTLNRALDYVLDSTPHGEPVRVCECKLDKGQLVGWTHLFTTHGYHWAQDPRHDDFCPILPRYARAWTPMPRLSNLPQVSLPDGYFLD